MKRMGTTSPCLSGSWHYGSSRKRGGGGCSVKQAHPTEYGMTSRLHSRYLLSSYGVCAYRSTRGRRRPVLSCPALSSLGIRESSPLPMFYSHPSLGFLGGGSLGVRKKKGLDSLGRLVESCPFSLSPLLSIATRYTYPYPCQSSYLWMCTCGTVQRTLCLFCLVTSGTVSAWRLVSQAREGRFLGGVSCPILSHPKNTYTTRACSLGRKQLSTSETVAGLPFRRHTECGGSICRASSPNVTSRCLLY
ncbi:hypothetical protein LZ32DRAFT_336312 [Colletotrichum eremochloae]|nr:hypothetical protein LZ32DRAFT_336312 [Colletotrichum eremochloae]